MPEENNDNEIVHHYDVSYGNFASKVLAEVRREAFGEDIGQNSWLTADEWRRFIQRLDLTPASSALDIACGSGGPALFMARTVGCRVTGVDVNEQGIAAANTMTRQQGLEQLALFRLVDASNPLPFEDSTFDALTCIDAVNHLPNRLWVFQEWHRVLKSGGRLLFTDPITITGIVTNEEMALRSSIGFFLFAPRGEDERLLKEAGFELVSTEDVTQNMANIAKRRMEARANHRDDLIKIEGEATFEGQQRFFAIAHKLPAERRLSRFAFLARKP